MMPEKKRSGRRVAVGAMGMLFLVSADSDFIAGAELFVDGGAAAMMPGGD